MYAVVRSFCRSSSVKYYNNFQPLISQVCKLNLSKLTSAERYEAESESQRDTGLKMVEKLDIKRGSTILDLGCGTGKIAKVLSGIVGPEGKVVAVDPDEGRINIAREMYSAHNIEFRHADDKSFPPGKYDIIVSNVAIHWILDKEALFKRVYENLHPGGQFAFTTTDGPASMPEIGKRLFDELLGVEFLQRLMNEVKQYLTAEQYKTLATAAGFKLTALNREDIYVTWRNLDHYIEAMHGWFGGEFHPAQFNKAALQKLKEEYGNGPVEFDEPIKKLEIFLTKPNKL